MGPAHCQRLPVLPPPRRPAAAAALSVQAPLQPLQDNLESQTYETFEKDVTKYACYQAAVHKALLDRVPAEQADSTVTTLMVVGAGACACAQLVRELPLPLPLQAARAAAILRTVQLTGPPLHVCVLLRCRSHVQIGLLLQ